MLSKYAHVKGFALSNSLICHSMVFFNPLTYSLYPLTGYPLITIPQPPNKKFFRAPRELKGSGVAFETQYASEEEAIVKTVILLKISYAKNLSFGLHPTSRLSFNLLLFSFFTVFIF